MLNGEKLTKRELAAQIIFPRLDIDLYKKDADYANTIIELASSGVGGFCVFGGTNKDVKKILINISSFAKQPILYCADFENGTTMRVSGGTEFPHAMALGRMDDLTKVYTVANCIAKESASLGIHWNLSPVTDVNSDPNNPIINIRAFGDDLETVIKNSGTFIMGTQSENVIATAKHFPGHGDTSIDSHIGLPKIDKDENSFKAFELVPFLNAIQTGVKSVMVGHLSVPAIESSDLPASLSRKITNDLLRKAMNFDGLIVTDALDMGALKGSFSNEEIVELAFLAGNDVLLLPEDPFLAIEVIERTINGNEKRESDIKRSIERITNAKKFAGLYENKARIEMSEKLMLDHEKYALVCATETLEIEGDESLLPIGENIDLAGFAVLQGEDIEKPTLFYKILAQAIENNIDFAYINKDIENMDLVALLDGIKDAEIVLFTTYFKSGADRGDVVIPDNLLEVMRKLSTGKKVISVNFGNPYIEPLIEADLHIKAYSDSLPSTAAAILKLAGRNIDAYNQAKNN